MSITAKSTLALLAIFLALFGGAWVVLEVAVSPRFEELEAAANARDVTRVEEQLGGVAAEMTARVADYAHWDDTYAYLAGRGPNYIASNFTDNWFTEYGADFLLFAGDDGNVLWSRGRDSEGRYGADRVMAAQFIAQGAAADGEPSAGVIWTAGGPMVYAASRSTRSDGSGRPRGLVVIARRLDAASLARQLQLDLRLLAAGEASRIGGAHFAELLETGRATWRTANTTYSLLPLRDNRRVVGVVLAEQRRELTVLGVRTIAAALGLLSIMFACAFGAFWLLLERVVIGRLGRIERHFQQQAGDPAPLPADAAGDEISKLTDAYNALVVRLEAAVESEQRALLEREAAAAANRMKSDFLANISHELRTPLNAVIGYAELIEEDLAASGVATAKEDLNRITVSARRLLALINEILDLSRIEGDRLEIRPEAFRVDELMHGVVEAAKPLAHAQGNVLLLEFENDLGVAYNDHIRLRQSLINVLTHACKRTHASAVRLRAERRAGVRGDELRFTVIDGGPKLTPAQIDDLFELFVRANENASTGARLGLAVTRKLLTLMGGRIEVRNNTTGGCAFVVTVPLAAREAASSQSAA